ncbi:hypothetical protein WAI453_011911 [Rhynchosporium graminicola]
MMMMTKFVHGIKVGRQNTAGNQQNIIPYPWTSPVSRLGTAKSRVSTPPIQRPYQRYVLRNFNDHGTLVLSHHENGFAIDSPCHELVPA